MRLDDLTQWYHERSCACFLYKTVYDLIMMTFQLSQQTAK